MYNTHNYINIYSLCAIFSSGAKDLYLTTTTTKKILDMRNSLLSCWPTLSSRFPKHTPIAITLGCSQEVEGKFLLMKVPCASDQGPEDRLTKEGGSQQFCTAVMPSNHGSDEHCIISPRGSVI